MIVMFERWLVLSTMPGGDGERDGDNGAARPCVALCVLLLHFARKTF
jgi:hypothetical protein